MGRGHQKARDVAGPTTAATVALTRAGIRFTPDSYAHDASATDFGAEAARELGIELGLPSARIFKTLLRATGGSYAAIRRGSS